MKEKLHPDVEAIIKAAMAVADDVPVYYDDTGVFRCAHCDAPGANGWFGSIQHEADCRFRALQIAIGVYDRRDA